MTNTVWAILVIIALALAGFGWWYYAQPAPSAAPAQTGTSGASGGTGIVVGVDAGTTLGSAPMSASVAYGTDGFSPQEVTIKKGGTVTWQSGGGNMWVASAQHPTHTLYSGTALADHCPDGAGVAFDQCKSGATYSFKFDKTGTWAYHNHSNSAHFGRVIVVE